MANPQPEDEALQYLTEDPTVADALRNIERALKRSHAANSAKQVVGADEAGVFLPSPLRSPPPFIVDANVLFQDIAYSCHHDGALTTLVNGANAGLFRLYMTEQVAAEIDEYRNEKPTPGKIEPELWLRVWNQNYRPLIRLVDPVPDGLLSSEETSRIGTLRLRDKGRHSNRNARAGYRGFPPERRRGCERRGLWRF